MGVLGYHVFEGLDWLDALVNASMLLGGMGPVSELHTVAGKLFASFYALYSGMIFLIAVGVLFAPLLHRFLHHFHLEMEEEEAPATTDLHPMMQTHRRAHMAAVNASDCELRYGQRRPQ